MERKKRVRGRKAKPQKGVSFCFRPEEEAFKAMEAETHLYGKDTVCKTETRGFARPGNRSELELVVDASAGFIPLWQKNSTLRWRFQKQSLAIFEDPEQVKDQLRELFGEALLEWGDAAPVKFAEREDLWDFEISIRHANECYGKKMHARAGVFPRQGTEGT